MKAKNKRTQAVIRRIPIDVIAQAKQCDLAAMDDILRFYKGYMLELCKFDLYDASGNAYTCYDEDMYHELEIKLMTAILTKFQVE